MSASDASPESPGLLASLRRLGVTALGALHTRLALAGIEIEEEITRLVGLLILAFAALLLAATGLLVLTFLVVVVFWDTNRVAALLGLGAVYLVLAALLGARVQRILRTRPPVLRETLAELEKDRAALGMQDDSAGDGR